MKKIYSAILSLALFGGLLMSGCASLSSTPSNPTTPPTQPARPTQPADSQTPAPAATGSGLANPASVNCVQKGNRLEIRTAADGGQVGICIFPDGSECEEWAFFRGECGPGTPASPIAGAGETATAASGTGTLETPVGAATATPGQQAVIDPAVQKRVVGAAQSLLAKKLNVQVSEISLVSIAAVSWPDSCLGLPGPDEMCAQMVTDGFKVVLAANGQNYSFHTDQTGRNVRQEP
jgi:putative hemolysin